MFLFERNYYTSLSKVIHTSILLVLVNIIIFVDGGSIQYINVIQMNKPDGPKSWVTVYYSKLCFKNMKSIIASRAIFAATCEHEHRFSLTSEKCMWEGKQRKGYGEGSNNVSNVQYVFTYCNTLYSQINLCTETSQPFWRRLQYTSKLYNAHLKL